MSINHLEEPQDKILQVDGSLQEDSVRLGQNNSLQKSYTEASNINPINGNESSIIEQNQKLKNSIEKEQLVNSAILQGSQKLESSSEKLQQSGINVSMINSQLSIEMNSDIEEYFQPYQTEINKQKGQKSGNFIKEANSKIRKQIKLGQIKISEQQRQLNFDQEFSQRKQTKRIEELEDKKHRVIQELRIIDREENQLRIQKKAHTSRSRVKVQLTEEDRHNLIELIKAKRQFQLSLDRKNQEIRQQAKNWRSEENQKVKQRFLQQNQKKKEKILQRMKELQLNFQQRQDSLKQSVLRRKEKYVHKKIQQNWSQSRKEQEQQTERKLKKLHERHKFNIQQIKNHDKKYLQSIEKRAYSQKIFVNHHSLPKRQKTQFDKIIEQEIDDIKDNNYKKTIKMLEHSFRDKIIEFQQKVNQNHMPKIDPEKVFIPPITRAYSSLCLSKEERDEKGLQYLAKAKVMKKNQSMTTQVKVIPNQEVVGNKIYKNYLQKGEKKKKLQNPLKRQFRQIIDNQVEVQDYQSAVRAVNLANGLSAISKKQGDNHIFYSMKTKLKLLQNLN